MEKKTLQIAIISVLSYLIFKKTYDILAELLLWINVELRIENEFALVSFNIVIGLSSLLLLIFLYNSTLNKDIIETKVVYLLIGLSIILTLIMGGINKLYTTYLINNEIGDFQKTYLFQFGWSKTLDMIFPILGLIYFLWKLKTKLKTVANNGE